MKIKLLILVTILLLARPVSLKAQTTQYVWDYVSSLQNEWLQKICTQGLDTVYIVGRNGLIAQSTDRALTWNKQYPVTTQLNDIIFCNHTTGFAVGNNGTILSTTDAGVNWTQQASGKTNNINAIAATGLDNIWAVGDSGLVVQSIDTGKTWVAIKLFPDTINLFDIKFKDSIGYIAGNHSRVLKTINSGTDWVNSDINLKINDPYFIDNTYSTHSLSITQNKVYAIISDGLYPARGMAISSEINVNNNWTEYKDIYSDPIRAGSMYSVDDSLRYYSGYDWTTGSGFGLWIYKTTDGGQNWNETTISNYYGGTINELSNFSFNSDNSFGYFLCGQIVLRTPYTGDFTGINETKSDLQTLQIKQQGEELQVSSLSKTISDIEIYSVTGAKICQRKNNVVNVHQIQSGVYFICARYTDNSKSNLVKWIRR